MSDTATTPTLDFFTSLYHQLERNDEALTYTLRDGKLPQKATQHQFIQDCIDLLLLISTSKLEGKPAIIPNLRSGLAVHMNTGEEKDLANIQKTIRPLVKDMSQPGGELLCVSLEETGHIINRCRLLLDLLQSTSEPSHSKLSVHNSAIVALNQDSFPAVYFNKSAISSLSVFTHLIMEETAGTRQAGKGYRLDGVVPAGNDLALKRIQVMQARSTLGNLMNGSICFPTEHDLHAGKEFLSALMHEYADEISRFTLMHDNHIPKEMQTLTAKMHAELGKKLREGGIEAGHSYVNTQFTMAEDSEIKSAGDAVQFLKTSGRREGTQIVLPLDKAPEQCTERLSAMAGPQHTASLVIHSADNTLRVPANIGGKIISNWKRFMTLAHTEGKAAAKAVIPLDGYPIQTVTADAVPNAEGVRHTTRIPSLEEVMPNNFPVLQSIMALCRRLDNVKGPDKYLSSKEVTELSFGSSELATAGRELLRGLTDHKGIIQKNNVLVVARPEKDAIATHYALMQEAVLEAKSAMNHGDEAAARQNIEGVKLLLGEATWAAATKYHECAAQRAIVNAR